MNKLYLNLKTLMAMVTVECFELCYYMLFRMELQFFQNVLLIPRKI